VFERHNDMDLEAVSSSPLSPYDTIYDTWRFYTTYSA